MLYFASIFDIPSVRRQFPILDQRIDGHPLVYLDNAATTQKPLAVLEAMDRFYRTENANVHRGMHVLAERATVAYEGAREAVRGFLNAKRPEEIVFTKNCTEAINLVARSWGQTLKAGDVIVLSLLEHHSNIVPWLQLKEQSGIIIEWIGLEDDGSLRINDLKKFLATGNVKLVAVTGQSNVLGVRPPLETIITMTHAAGGRVLVDGAQLIGHAPVDVQALDCDFLTFSGHKLYGPTGIGVLYGKRELLEAMPPFLGGGMMIGEVTTEHFTPADIPAKFEAGTQPIAEAVGLATAIEWLTQFSWNDIEKHENMLIQHATKKLGAINDLHLLGQTRNPPKVLEGQPVTRNSAHCCVSFTIDGVHPHDLTEILGRGGICLRAGHHCCQPLHRHLKIAASTRLSVGIYNTIEEIDAVVPAIEEAMKKLKAVSP